MRTTNRKNRDSRFNLDDAASNGRYHVPNLERALAIMEYLADQAHPRGITEIAADLSLPKNSVFRIATTLYDKGYLIRDSAKQFALSSKLLSLGYAAVGEGHLVEKAADVMRRVRDTVDETTLVGIIEGTEGVVLEQFESHQQVKVVVSIGTRFPLHTAAPAKAILAYMDEAERENILTQLTLTRFTDRTITTLPALRAELEAARQLGYAVDNGEHNDGIRCVGAAIFNQRSRPVGAIWAVGPAFRLRVEDFSRLGPILRDGAAEISQRFGHRDRDDR